MCRVCSAWKKTNNHRHSIPYTRARVHSISGWCLCLSVCRSCNVHVFERLSGHHQADISETVHTMKTESKCGFTFRLSASRNDANKYSLMFPLLTSYTLPPQWKKKNNKNAIWCRALNSSDEQTTKHFIFIISFLFFNNAFLLLSKCCWFKCAENAEEFNVWCSAGMRE